MKSLRAKIAKHLLNFKGWRTSRKIVVIESDDWGTICMPSKEIKTKLLKMGFDINKSPYAANDALASSKDLKKLFSVLIQYKDKKGNPPVITANTVMTNPDFEKIRNSGFKEYFSEPFTETLKKYPEHSNSFELWREGMNKKIFFPQFHGFEHINRKLWLNALMDDTSHYRSVFNKEVTWLGNGYTDGRVGMRSALDTESICDIEFQKEYIRDGLSLFEEIFGYRSKSFIAPNYVYHSDLNEVLYEGGVKYIQGMKVQSLPLMGHKKRELIRHYTGEQNDIGQFYLIRNCSFEPSLKQDSDGIVEDCLYDISNSFLWKKPVIISAHRLNFIGYIEPGNREKNLVKLNELLAGIIDMWPDVEFMTSNELGDLIASSVDYS